jgi:hypothetical protein
MFFSGSFFRPKEDEMLCQFLTYNLSFMVDRQGRSTRPCMAPLLALYFFWCVQDTFLFPLL